MDKELFWSYVVGYKPDNPSETSGWNGLRNEMRAMARRWFPNVSIDEDAWEGIELYALSNAVRNFDPQKGSISTYLMNWTRSGIDKWIRKSKRQPMSIPFSKFEQSHEDWELLERIPFYDLYAELSLSKAEFIMMTLRTDVSILAHQPSIRGYLVSHLVSDIVDGLSSMEIAAKLGVSYKTIDRAKAAVAERMQRLGIRDEIFDRVARENQLSRVFKA